MTKNELQTLCRGVFNKNNEANFADVNAAVLNGIREFYNVDENTKLSSLQGKNFSEITEVIDEILPQKMQEVMGQFATIKSFARNEEVKFVLKNVGQRRVMSGVVEGARGGVYEARRLDDKELTISCKIYTCGAYITLEDLILGTRTLQELVNLIVDGLTQRIYGEVVKALRGVQTNAPSANVASAAGIDGDALTKVIRVVRGYGAPVIICFETLAAKLLNNVATAVTPNVNAIDLEEIRNRGYVSIYHGTPVIVMPNYILDETTNASWAFSEKDAFILPTVGKPVYVALKGDGYTTEFRQPSGSVEMNYHRMMGIGILLYNNLGIYRDTDIVAAEASDDNEYAY